MAQAAFWINKEAVFNFGGKDYKYGDKLPAGVDDAAITAFIKKGKVSRTAPSAPAAAPGEVELLKGRVQELVIEATALTHQLAAARGDLDAVRDELAAANQTIEQLTATALTPAAGPRKEGK